MQMKREAILLCVFLPLFLFSQQKEELNKLADSIFFDVVTKIAPSDINRAHEIVDSMYVHSESNLFKIRALFLSSWFYNTSGFSEKSVYMALKAEELAIKSKNYEWQFRILGFLSAQFQNIGLLKEREELLERMEKLIPKVTDLNARELLYPMYYHEKTLYYLNLNDENKATENVKIAKEYMHKLPDIKSKNMLLSVNESAHGLIFLQFHKQPDSALAHFNKAIYFKEQAQATGYQEDFLYSALGQVYLMKKKDSLGLDYMRKAEILSESSDNAKLKLEIYKVFSDYYKQKNDTTSYVLYLEKHKILYDKLLEEKVKPVELLLENIKKENQQLRYNRMTLSVITVVLMIGFGWSYLIYRNKRKKEYHKFKETFDQLKNNNLDSTNNKTKQSLHREKLPEKAEEKPEFSIPEQTEQKIIKELQHFEKGTKFLTSNFTLADLASEISVNTKYLSYILKKSYEKDFNTYINELRINYIITKLRTNKKYRLYKLSFMAEECGFSSHSKFSAVFKSVTGITPTKFINSFKKDAAD